MAPLRLLEEEFVPTIYDDDAASLEDEEDVASEAEIQAVEPTKVQKSNDQKRKREESQGSRKRRKASDKEHEQAGTDGAGDGEIDPGFDFQLEDGVADFDEDEQFADGEKELGMRSIDEIVAARKQLRKQAAEEDADQEEMNSEDGGEDVDDIELSDEEVLADDAFGMAFDQGEDEGAEFEDGDDGSGEGSEDGSSDDLKGGNDKDEDEAEAEDFAAPRSHPMDLVNGDASSDSEAEDAEETARREAFFAPESNDSRDAVPNGSGSFMDFKLSRPILRGISAAGFSTPTPIQARTIPIALLGKDVVGSAVTGSGKTGAFMVPILERLFYRSREHSATRVVILTPTRELALQCYEVAMKLASHTDITFGQAIGGLNQRVQETALKRRPDVIIATPGRFIDFMRNSSALQTDGIEILVLDEADRMLEDGFADELNEILSTLPRKRQTMLFSATMTSSVDDLIRVGCQRPVRLAVDAGKQTVQGLVQEFIRLRPGKEHLRLAYLLHLCTTTYTRRTIVFFRQKATAHRVRVLFALLGLQAAELHGAMTQDQRIAAVTAFRTGGAAFLLATDLAARGLDIKGVEGVINFEAPQSHEIYLHRVGRTARAGRSGRSCTLAAEADRKVVKSAVRAGRVQGAVIKSRSVPGEEAERWAREVAGSEAEVEAVLREEKEDKVLRRTEMQARRAENIMTHEREILARPKKTWFQGEKDKVAAREKGRRQLNGTVTGEGGGSGGGGGGGGGFEAKVAEMLEKQKGKKKLTNKERKRLALRDERNEGRMWKKGKEERGKKIVSQKGAGKGKAGGAGKGKKGSK